MYFSIELLHSSIVLTNKLTSITHTFDKHFFTVLWPVHLTKWAILIISFFGHVYVWKCQKIQIFGNLINEIIGSSFYQMYRPLKWWAQPIFNVILIICCPLWNRRSIFTKIWYEKGVSVDLFLRICKIAPK